VILLRAATLVLVVGTVLAAPVGAGAGKIVLNDSLGRGQATQVSVTVRKPAAFELVLRTSGKGRTKLFLLGKTAPKGGALIDTQTTACDGTSVTRVCTGRYESLPPGTYAFRIVVSGATPKPAPVVLTVKWP
jgi:hypothetical protein